MHTESTPADHEVLERFLRDWLRHCGRKQADLRRALRVPSSRMPVILEALDTVQQREGLQGLASALCRIEGEWHQRESLEDTGSTLDSENGMEAQLDFLLEEIRQSGDR